jgi:hypothetical protein
MVKNGLRTGFRRDIGVVLERFGFEVAGGGMGSMERGSTKENGRG